MVISTTSIQTSTGGVVKASRGTVFWILASAGATGGAWTIENHPSADTGTALISAVSPATGIVFMRFDPAVEFTDGIYADIDGTNITLTIGYQ